VVDREFDDFVHFLLTLVGERIEQVVKAYLLYFQGLEGLASLVNHPTAILRRQNDLLVLLVLELLRDELLNR